MKDHQAAATPPTAHDRNRRRPITVRSLRGRLWLTGRVVVRSATGAPSKEPTESTRYLCAAAQLDPTFRAQVLRSTIEERHRAIAPSFGVDVPQVVKHCLMADRRELMRDVCMTALLIAVVPALLLGTPTSRLALTLLILAAAYAIIWIDELSVHHVIETRLRGGRFRPYELTFNVERNDVLSQVADRENANLIVYGRYHPFVGSGVEIERWPLTVDLRREARRRRGNTPPTPERFECRELYDHVAEAVEHLGLDGVTVEERLYVNGRSLRDKPEMLSDPFTRPSPRVEPSTFEEFVGRAASGVRHYQCIQAVTWSGDLVLSFLIRFEITGGHLFVEVTVLALGPIHRRYKQIDRLPYIPLWRKALELVPGAATGALGQMPRAPSRLIDRIHCAWCRRRDEKRNRDLISVAIDYNYGAVSSLRERVSSTVHAHHFQERDTTKYIRIVEGRVLYAIVEFLDAKGVDTTALKKQETTIMNNIFNHKGNIVNSGTMVAGGTIDAENIAGGKGARVS
jgi:hypothetical protein